MKRAGLACESCESRPLLPSASSFSALGLASLHDSLLYIDCAQCWSMRKVAWLHVSIRHCKCLRNLHNFISCSYANMSLDIISFPYYMVVTGYNCFLDRNRHNKSWYKKTHPELHLLLSPLLRPKFVRTGIIVLLLRFATQMPEMLLQPAERNYKMCRYHLILVCWWRWWDANVSHL